MGAPDVFFIDSWKEWYAAVGVASLAFRDFKARGGGAKIAEGAWYVVSWPVGLVKAFKK